MFADLIQNFNPVQQEIGQYEQQLRVIDKQLQEKPTQEVYLISKSWIRKWKLFVNFLEEEDLGDMPRPPVVNKDLITNEVFLMPYQPANSTLNVSVRQFKHDSEYEIVSRAQYETFQSKYSKDEHVLIPPIVRLAIFDETTRTKKIHANLMRVNIIYMGPNSTYEHGIMQVDQHAIVRDWKKLLATSFATKFKFNDLRLWRNNQNHLPRDRVLNQLKDRTYDGTLIEDNQYVLGINLKPYDSILVDFQFEDWQFTQANQKFIIRDIYLELFSRMHTGCGKEVCAFAFCHCNPEFSSNTYTKEELAPIALHLLQDNYQIAADICDIKQPCISLSLEKIRKYKDRDVATVLLELSKFPETFGVSFSHSKDKKFQDSAFIDMDALDFIHAQLMDLKQIDKNVNYINNWIETLYSKLLLQPESITNIYQLRSCLLISLIRFFNEQTLREPKVNTLLKVICELSDEYKEQLAKWLCFLDATQFSDYLSQISKRIKEFIGLQQKKPLPLAELDDVYNMKCLLEYYRLFYLSNKLVARVPYQNFQITEIMKFYLTYSDQKEFQQFRYFKKQIWRNYYFTFCNYPFAVTTEFKSQILNIESRVEQNQKVRSSIFGYAFLTGQLPYLKLEVNRNDIIGTVLKQIQQSQVSLKMPLKVQFQGEQGVDEGGVRREFFSLLMEQLFNLDYGMFILKAQDTILWFNPHSLEMPIQYELIGIVLGLALYNQILLDLKFPSVVYKKLQKEKITVEDLKELDIELYQGLIQIRNYVQPDFEDVFTLTFQVSYNVWGENFLTDLKPNGSQLNVTQNNKEEYIRLYADWYLNKSIERQFYLFQKGFEKVVSGDGIKLFVGEELQKLIVGSPHFDMKELETVTKYDGYNPNEAYIKAFWSLIHSLDLSQQKRFLFFCTGSDRVPVGGLKSMKFIIQKHGEDTDQLPSAHTCFNVLLLPQYKSTEVMRTKLMISLMNAEGFGLM